MKVRDQLKQLGWKIVHAKFDGFGRTSLMQRGASTMLISELPDGLPIEEVMKLFDSSFSGTTTEAEA